MKLFELRRNVDKTGVSGTGVVAQGVIFDNGWCALTWLTDHTSAAFCTDIAEVLAIHGHSGATEIMQIADCDMDKARRLCQAAMMDDLENVAVEFMAGNHKRVNAERYEFADMFLEKNLAFVLANK